MTREEKLAAIAAAKAQQGQSAFSPPQAQASPTTLSREDKIAAIAKAKNQPMTKSDNRPIGDRMADLPSNIWDTVKTLPGVQWEAVKKLASGAGTALGYPGGIARTSLASGFDDESGRTGIQGPTPKSSSVVTPEDWKQTFRGNAPGLGEYMKRAGVPEMNVDMPLVARIPGREVLGFAGDMATDPLTYMGGELLGPAGHVVGDAVENAGTKLYKSGVKNLDLEGARYGKEPVSDVLFQNRVKGSATSIQQQMDELGDTLLAEKKGILKQGTAAGAEVDMNAAVKRAEDFLAEQRAKNHPEMKTALDALQSRIDKYKATAGKAPEDILRTLPYTAEEKILVPQNELPGYKTNETPIKHEFDLAGRDAVPEHWSMPNTSEGTAYYTPKEGSSRVMPTGTDGIPQNSTDAIRLMRDKMPRTNSEATLDVINNASDEIIGLPRPMTEQTVLAPRQATVIDQAERVLGPTPLQTDAWKSSNNGALDDNIWRQLNASGQGAGFDKALNGGLRDATQESIAQRLGPEMGEQLAEKNDQLGRILTSSEKAQLDAEREARKNFITPVDTTIASLSWPAFIAKKAGDISKLPAFRTNTGLLMNDFGKTRAPDALARKFYVDQSREDDTPQTPWLYMGGN